MALFTPEELRSLGGWLEVDLTRAATVERVVAGLLRGKVAAAIDWDAPPPQVVAWALELGVLIYENPGALAQSSTGDSWIITRRNEILSAAEAYAPAGDTGAPAGAPRGSFPPPLPWPDPIRYC